MQSELWTGGALFFVPLLREPLQALAAHQSQTPAHWTELIRRHNAFYGARCNRQYAEGFRRLPLAFVNNLPAYEYLP